MVFRWPIEIDGLPINSMVIFHGELLNNQMVPIISPLYPHDISIPNGWTVRDAIAQQVSQIRAVAWGGRGWDNNSKENMEGKLRKGGIKKKHEKHGSILGDGPNFRIFWWVLLNLLEKRITDPGSLW